ncbi:MAG: hypothetical protein ACOC8F_04200 [Planctomycetota bacterium]
MTRYGRIESIAFGATDLPLPVSVRVARRADARPAGGQTDRFATSVELAAARAEVEVRLRGTAAAEALDLAATATLRFVGESPDGGDPHHAEDAS